MLKDNLISLEKKIYYLISLPLKIVLNAIEEDEELKNLDYKIIIADEINFKTNSNYKQNLLDNFVYEFSKENIQKFEDILNDNKLRVINIKKQENTLNIYIAREILEILN
ncbi:MAG: hypothetical protein ACP5RD_01915 [bacterium]|jgi:hypothetical protein